MCDQFLQKFKFPVLGGTWQEKAQRIMDFELKWAMEKTPADYHPYHTRFEMFGPNAPILHILPTWSNAQVEKQFELLGLPLRMTYGEMWNVLLERISLGLPLAPLDDSEKETCVRAELMGDMVNFEGFQLDSSSQSEDGTWHLVLSVVLGS